MVTSLSILLFLNEHFFKIKNTHNVYTQRNLLAVTPADVYPANYVFGFN